jgi:hypothetical protein
VIVARIDVHVHICTFSQERHALPLVESKPGALETGLVLVVLRSANKLHRGRGVAGTRNSRHPTRQACRCIKVDCSSKSDPDGNRLVAHVLHAYPTAIRVVHPLVPPRWSPCFTLAHPCPAFPGRFTPEGGDSVYGELRGHENGFHEDKGTVGYSPFLEGLSYENVLPAVIALSVIGANGTDPEDAATALGLDVARLDATWRMLRRDGSFQWINQDASLSAFLPTTHINATGLTDPPVRPDSGATPSCDEKSRRVGAAALTLASGTDMCDPKATGTQCGSVQNATACCTLCQTCGARDGFRASPTRIPLYLLLSSTHCTSCCYIGRRRACPRVLMILTRVGTLLSPSTAPSGVVPGSSTATRPCAPATVAAI